MYYTFNNLLDSLNKLLNELDKNNINIPSKLRDDLEYIKEFYSDNKEGEFNITETNPFQKIIVKKENSMDNTLIEDLCKSSNIAFIQIQSFLQRDLDVKYKEIYKYLKNDINREDGKTLIDDINAVQIAAETAKRIIENKAKIESEKMLEDLQDRIKSIKVTVRINTLYMFLCCFFITLSPCVTRLIYSDFSLSRDYLALLPIISPCLLMFFYFSKRGYSLYKQKVDTEFKYDSVRSFLAYNSITIISSDKDNVRRMLLANLVEALAQNPTRLYDKNPNNFKEESNDMLNVLKDIKDIIKTTKSN